MEPWWNPGGTLVEPSWNLTSGPPRTPEPIWVYRPQSFQLLGKKPTCNRPRGFPRPRGPIRRGWVMEACRESTWDLPEGILGREEVARGKWEVAPEAPRSLIQTTNFREADSNTVMGVSGSCLEKPACKGRAKGGPLCFHQPR